MSKVFMNRNICVKWFYFETDTIFVVYVYIIYLVEFITDVFDVRTDNRTYKIDSLRVRIFWRQNY